MMYAIDKEKEQVQNWTKRGEDEGECKQSYITGPNSAVVMSSANGLVGTGFASRYRLQCRAGF